MKIIRLSASNIKRLSAVEITPHGALITIGGKNGAGKTSVLDSIAYALGGEKLVPSDPIRQGERAASIEVDLGDLLVMRKFWREKTLDGWGPTKSTLTVLSKEGARYPSPQAVVDRLLGKLTFDPLEFARAKPKERFEILRRLVGLDLTEVDMRRQIAASKRSMEKGIFELKSAQLAGMKTFQITQEVEEPTTAAVQAIVDAESTEKRAIVLKQESIRLEDALTRLDESSKDKQRRIAELTQIINLLTNEIAVLEDKRVDMTRAFNLKVEEANAAAAQIVDVKALRQKVSDIELRNQQVRANQAQQKFFLEVSDLEQRVKQHDQDVKAIDKERGEKLIQAAQDVSRLTVPGLSLTDDGVLYNGFPFEQASTSEQLRASIAIGLALNPTLKVLLIRNGNALDDTSMELVAQQAAQANAQVWCEYVTDSADGVSVMIEDGHLAAAAVAPAPEGSVVDSDSASPSLWQADEL